MPLNQCHPQHVGRQICRIRLVPISIIRIFMFDNFVREILCRLLFLPGAAARRKRRASLLSLACRRRTHKISLNAKRRFSWRSCAGAQTSLGSYCAGRSHGGIPLQGQDSSCNDQVSRQNFLNSCFCACPKQAPPCFERNLQSSTTCFFAASHPRFERSIR